MKVFKGLNLISAMLCACMLDSESYIPVIVLIVNMIILTAPEIYKDIKKL